MNILFKICYGRKGSYFWKFYCFCQYNYEGLRCKFFPGKILRDAMELDRQYAAGLQRENRYLVERCIINEFRLKAFGGLNV